MLIAIPNCQGRVSPVFDVAARLLLIRLKGEAELQRREVVLCVNQPNDMVSSLVELGVDVLVCGAISRLLQAALTRAHIRVVPQICGEIDAVIAAYQGGRLDRPEFIMPGCCGGRWRASDRASFLPAASSIRINSKRERKER